MSSVGLPEVTFVTITYNNAKGLRRTAGSVNRFRACVQANDRFEWVVVDGASTDETLSILNEYSPDRLVSEPDSGIYDAMNKGVALARGKYVLFLNAGDCLLPEGMIKLIERIAQEGIYIGTAQWYGGQLRRFGYIDFSPRLLRMPNHQSMLFPRQFLVDHPFDLRFFKSADLDNKLSAYQELPFYFEDIAVVECEVGGLSQEMSSFKVLIRGALDHAIIAKRHFGLFWAVTNFIKGCCWGIVRLFRAKSPFNRVN